MAPWMFYLSLLFLGHVGLLLVLWVDIPRVSLASLEGTEDYEKYEGLEHFYESDLPWDVHSRTLGDWVFRSTLILWPLIGLESLATIWLCRDQPLPKRWRLFRLMMCLVPPLRLCPVHPDMRGRAWLPYYGWRTASDRLRRRIELTLSGPMIAAALLILPILIIEWTMKKQIADSFWLRLLLHTGTGCIWFAFATEFLIMVSISRRKFEYLKKHWIDLAIILLPLLSFLRSLQILRLSRLGKLAKLEQLSRMIRIYRLRGLSMRMFRALLVLEVLHRMFRLSPEKRRTALLDQIAAKNEELEELHQQLAAVEAKIRERQ